MSELSNSRLQELFQASEQYAGRKFCLSTDGAILHECASNMPSVASELMRRRREAEQHARQIQERDRDILRLRMTIRDLERS